MDGTSQPAPRNDPEWVNPERVNDLMKRGMHRLIARRLRREPAAIERARAVLALWRSDREVEPYYVQAWERLLGCGPDEVARKLTERSREMAELRSSSPLSFVFGQLLDDKERRRLWRTSKAILSRSSERSRS